MHYRPVEGWGRLPEGWSFVEATSVAVDPADNVWVFNRGAHPVIMFDREGTFRRAWGEGLIRRAHGITIGPDGTLWLTDDLHHTDSPVHAGGEAAPDHRRSRHPVHAPGRPAVQSPHPRGALSEDGRHLHLGRLRQLAGAQVRSQGPPPVLLGRARHRSRVLQSPPQHRHGRGGARLRGRPREPPRAGLRRQGPVPHPAQQSASAVRALLRSTQRRRPLRRGAAHVPGRERRGGERRGARERADPQGRRWWAGWAAASPARSPASSWRLTAASWIRGATSTWPRSRGRRREVSRIPRARSARSRSSSWCLETVRLRGQDERASRARSRATDWSRGSARQTPDCAVARRPGPRAAARAHRSPEW